MAGMSAFMYSEGSRDVMDVSETERCVMRGEFSVLNEVARPSLLSFYQLLFSSN